MTEKEAIGLIRAYSSSNDRRGRRPYHLAIAGIGGDGMAPQ